MAVTRPDTTAPPPSNAPAVELKTIQIATRWLVGAAASVLAVLLAGVHLSALGQLAADRPERLTIAITAGAVGLLAVGTILVLAARVLVSPGWTLSELAHLETQRHWQHHWLQRELEAQRGLLTPGDELQPSRLYRRHRRLYVAWFELLEKGATTLPDDLDNEHHNPADHSPANHNPGRNYSVTNNDDVERLRRRLDEAANISEGIATVANLAATRRRYRRLVRTLPILGILTVIAVPLFAWATTVQPEPAITTPIAIHIKFIPDRATLQRAGLAPNCANRDINAIAVGGTLPRPIVSTNDPSCTLNQIRITPTLGTAIPALPQR